MSDTVTVALIAVLGTLLGTMLSPVVEYFREKRADQRSRAHERLTTLEKTYEDVLVSLSNWLIKIERREDKMPSHEDNEQLIIESNRYGARLQLVSIAEIAKQYDETVVRLIDQEMLDLLDRNAGEELADMPTLYSNWVRPRSEAYDSLAQRMRQHLESVRKQAT